MQTVALQSAQINALLTWELSSIYTSPVARRVSLFPRPPQESWTSRHDATAPSGHWFIPQWDEDIQLATYEDEGLCQNAYVSQGFEYFPHVYMPATNDWTTDGTDQSHAYAPAASSDEAIGHELPLQGPVNEQESPTGESALTLPWCHNPYAPGSAVAHGDSAEQHFDYDNTPVKIRVHPASIAETHNTPAVSTCEPPPGSSVCGGVTIAPDAGHQQLSTSAAAATQLPKCCSQDKESETESIFESAFASANYWSSLDATNALVTARQDTTVSEAGESEHEIDRESLPAPVTCGATFDGDTTAQGHWYPARTKRCRRFTPTCTREHFGTQIPRDVPTHARFHRRHYCAAKKVRAQRVRVTMYGTVPPPNRDVWGQASTLLPDDSTLEPTRCPHSAESGDTPPLSDNNSPTSSGVHGRFWDTDSLASSMSSAHSLAKGGSANGYAFFEQSCATSVMEDLDWLDDACFSAHRHLCNDTIVKGHGYQTTCSYPKCDCNFLWRRVQGIERSAICCPRWHDRQGEKRSTMLSPS